jgi:hypothetical protein
MNKYSLTILTLALLLPTLATGAATCRPELASTSPDANFTVHDNGTATDTSTKLMWKTCSEGLQGKLCKDGQAQMLNWSDTIASASKSNQEKFAGHTDWRVPNLKELQSLVEARCFNPGINENIFPNTAGTWFWSSTSVASSPGAAWGIGFGAGYGFAKDKNSQTGMVRLVRDAATQ